MTTIFLKEKQKEKHKYVQKMKIIGAIKVVYEEIPRSTFFLKDDVSHQNLEKEQKEGRTNLKRQSNQQNHIKYERDVRTNREFKINVDI